MATPLKLVNTKDLREFDSDGLNYLAYQGSLLLAEIDSSQPSALCKIFVDSSTNTRIGGFADTFYNQAVGTHPGSSLTIGSTTYDLYQTKGTASEADSDVRSPLKQGIAGDSDLSEQISSEIDTLADDLVSRIMAYQYPGAFKLGSSVPDSDYTLYSSNIFTDTQTSGTVTNYNLYIRNAFSLGTPPSAVRSVAIRRSAGKTGDYQGIQEMTDRQIKYTFGQRAKTRIMSQDSANDLKIGRYLLKSSADGAPTNTGTWQARGTAVDTRKTTADADYTTDFEGIVYETTYETTFTGNYIGDFVGDFVGDFEGAYTSDYTNPDDPALDSTLNSTQNSTSDFVEDYTGDFVGNFVGDFLGPVTYTGDFVGTYVGDFTGNFIGDFTGNFIGDFLGPIAYEGTYINPDGIGYINVDAINYQGPITYTGNYTNVNAIAYTNVNAINYYGPGPTFYGPGPTYYGPSPNRATDYTRDSTRNRYSAPAETFYLGNYIGNFVGNFTNINGIAYTNVNAIAYTNVNAIAYAGPGPTYYGPGPNRVTDYTNPNAANYYGPGPTFYGPGPAYFGNYTNPDALNSTRDSTQNSTADSTRNSTGPSDENFTTGYTDPDAGNSTNDSTANSTSVFAGNYVGDFVGDFVGNFLGPITYTGDFVGVYTTNSVGPNSTADATEDYVGTFVGTFGTNYTGNFLGETIQSGSSTVETYTLYCRVA